MTDFCLVRHGQTDWNLQGRYQGQSDISLNETGIEQANAVARLLRDENFDALFSSDLARARETANVIASFHAGLVVRLDSRLREISQGQWEGLQVENIQTRFAELWQERAEDPIKMHAPGGESLEEVMQRVSAALEEIAAFYPHGRILIVSHGLVLALTLCKVRNIPLGSAYQHIPENAEPLWVSWPGPAGS